MCINLDNAKVRSSWKELTFHSLPNNKILDWSKFKTFVDDKINLNQNMKFDMGGVENIVGKKRKYWLPAFSPFPTMF